MEQARCWVWPKRKLDLMVASHHHQLLAYSASSSSNGESWEEQAFAEDAAGALGAGCVWPPRSYTCSFCRREFRSAQALGGHMNVHRRDRARLKQSSPSDGDGAVPNNANNNNHAPLPKYSPPVAAARGGDGSLLYNHSSDSDHWIRVSTEQYKKDGLSAWSNMSVGSRFKDEKNGEKKELLLDLRKRTAIDEAEENLKILDSFSCWDHKAEHETRITLTTTRPTDQDVLPSCKRRKIDANPTFGLFPKPGSDILSNPIEELDLELRLGDPPKVK